MATVTGPLHSDAASGQFAKGLVYQRGKRKSVVKTYSKPGDASPITPSASHEAVILKTKLLAKLWPFLSDLEKATWEPMAASLRISPFNAFTKVNHRRWSNLDYLRRCPSSFLDYSVYRGASYDPNLDDWDFSFFGSGSISTSGTDVVINQPENLTIAEIIFESDLDGQLDFSGCPYLTDIYLPSSLMSRLPIITGLAVLSMFNCNGGSFSSTSDVDNFFITLAASTQVLEGVVILYSGTTAKPSAASAASRELLTSMGWTLLTN